MDNKRTTLLERRTAKKLEKNSEEKKTKTKSLRERWKEHRDKITTGVS